MKNVEEEIKNIETEIAERLKKLEHLKQMKEDAQYDEILGRVFSKNVNDYCTPSIYNEVEYVPLDSHSEEHIREIYKNGLLFNDYEECKNFSNWIRADKILRDTIKVENHRDSEGREWGPEEDGVTVFYSYGDDDGGGVRYHVLDCGKIDGYGHQEYPREYYMYNWVVADRVLKKLGEEFIRFALLRRL